MFIVLVVVEFVLNAVIPGDPPPKIVTQKTKVAMQWSAALPPAWEIHFITPAEIKE